MSETTGIFRKLSSKLDHTPNDIPMGKRLGCLLYTSLRNRTLEELLIVMKELDGGTL